jgi:hypothetical protein
MTSTLPNPSDVAPSTQSWWTRAMSTPATAISTIWLTVVLSGLLAPDMVTGSEHEHLPIAGLTVWVWATVASWFVAMGARRVQDRSSLVVWSSCVWLVVLVAVLTLPSLVTGTDPTTIPLVVLLAPVIGAFATGIIALWGCPTRD